MNPQILVVLMLCSCIFLQQSVSGQSALGREFLRVHNQYRAQHQANALTWDRNLENIAQQWANKLVNQNKLEHRPNNRYGENLYASWGNLQADPIRAVKVWYDEIKYYDFNRPGFSMRTGHFTQVVWRGTRSLGCAVARKADKTVVVCNYNPPGNVQGRYPENVRR